MRLSISCCSQSAGLSKPGVRTVPWQPVVEQESREVVNFEQDMPRGHPHAATGSRSWHQPGDTSGDMGFLGAEALGTGAAPPPAEEKTVTKESAHSRLKYRQRSVLGQISGGRASLRGSRGHQPGRGDGRGGKAPDPEPCRGGAPPPAAKTAVNFPLVESRRGYQHSIVADTINRTRQPREGTG